MATCLTSATFVNTGSPYSGIGRVELDAAAELKAMHLSARGGDAVEGRLRCWRCNDIQSEGSVMRRRLSFAVIAAAASVICTSVAWAGHFPNQTLHPDTGPAGTTVQLGNSYEHNNGGGGRIIWKGGASCTTPTTDLDYDENELILEHAENEISSVTDYNNCDSKLWKDTFQNGITTGWINAGSTPDNLPGFNDIASSLGWS